MASRDNTTRTTKSSLALCTIGVAQTGLRFKYTMSLLASRYLSCRRALSTGLSVRVRVSRSDYECVCEHVSVIVIVRDYEQYESTGAG